MVLARGDAYPLDFYSASEKAKKVNVLAKFSPFIYILLIAGAEVITSFFDYRLGFFCHCVIIFTLFGHAVFSYPVEKNRSYLLVSIALAPLIRIISLYAPLSTFEVLYWFAILSSSISFAIILLISIQHLNKQDIGLVLKLRQFPVQLAICFTGLPFGYIEFLILKPDPLVEVLSFRSLIFPVIILLVCTGFVEELIFRGIIQHNAIKYFNLSTGIFFVSLLFTIMHIGNLSLLDVVFVFLIGYFYAYSVKFTGSIVGVSISHGLTNVILFLVMPLLWTVLI